MTTLWDFPPDREVQPSWITWSASTNQLWAIASTFHLLLYGAAPFCGHFVKLSQWPCLLSTVLPSLHLKIARRYWQHDRFSLQPVTFVVLLDCGNTLILGYLLTKAFLEAVLFCIANNSCSHGNCEIAETSILFQEFICWRLFWFFNFIFQTVNFIFILFIVLQMGTLQV